MSGKSLYEIGGFIMTRKKAGETDGCFAVICAPEEAEFVSDGEKPVYFRYCTFDADTAEKIMGQTQGWILQVVSEETWDPSFGYTGKDEKRVYFREIQKSEILVENENFAGVIDYSKTLGETYYINSVLLDDYHGESHLFSSYASYGSSDHDMYEETSRFLLRKEHAADL